jgi:hypothetical protein
VTVQGEHKFQYLLGLKDETEQVYVLQGGANRRRKKVGVEGSQKDTICSYSRTSFPEATQS